MTLDSADLQDLDAVPSLRRNVAPTEVEGRQFHDRYQKAYGARGWDRDRDWQVNRGDHDLEFRRRDAQLADAQLADATEQDAARRERERQDREHTEQRRREAEQRLEAQRAQQQQQQQQAQAQAQAQSQSREVRWAQGQEEIVVERRPVIEEVVIRRRAVDPSSLQGGQSTGAMSGPGADSMLWSGKLP